MKRLKLLIVLSVLLAACTPKPKVIPKYEKGQFAALALNKERVQITYAFCTTESCSYTVRLQSLKEETGVQEFELLDEDK